MLQKLCQESVISELFGPRLHTEVVRRVVPVLKFLIHNGALGQQDLAFIWASQFEKHETVQLQILDVILQCLDGLPRELLFSLFENILSTDLRQLETRTFHFLERVMRLVRHRAENAGKYSQPSNTLECEEEYEQMITDDEFALARKSDQHNYAQILLETLFRFLMQPNQPYHDASTQAALRLFNEVLNRDLRPDMCSEWIQRIIACMCVQHGITDSNHVNSSRGIQIELALKFLHYANKLLVGGDEKMMSAQEFYDYITGPDASLFSALFNIVDDLAAITDGAETLLPQLFRLIDKVFEIHPTAPPSHHLLLIFERVWSAFLKDLGQSTKPLSAMIFKWSKDMIARFSESGLPEQVLSTLSRNNNKVESLSSIGFELLKAAFYSVNRRQGRLCAISKADRTLHDTVVVFPLEGLDLIWRCAFLSNDASVAVNASYFLVTIASCIDESLDRRSIREQMIDTCLEYLKNAGTL